MAEQGGSSKRAAIKGPNVVPIQRYLEAQRLFITGDRHRALATLSEAVGSDKPLERLEPHLEQVFDASAPLSEMTSHLVLTETKRRN